MDVEKGEEIDARGTVRGKRGSAHDFGQSGVDLGDGRARTQPEIGVDEEETPAALGVVDGRELRPEMLQRFEREEGAESQGARPGRILDDSSHPQAPVSTDDERPAQGRFHPEQLPGKAFGQDDFVGRPQGRRRVSLDPGEMENGEKRRIGEGDVVFVEDVVLQLEGHIVHGEIPGHALDLGDAFGDRGGEGRWRDPPSEGLAALTSKDGDEVEVLGVWVELVIAQFVVDPEQDEDGARHPHRQSEDVESRIPLMFDEIAEGDLQIAFEHEDAPFDLGFEKHGNGNQDLSPVPGPGFPSSEPDPEIAMDFLEIAEDRPSVGGEGDPPQDGRGQAGRAGGRSLHRDSVPCPARPGALAQSVS